LGIVCQNQILFALLTLIQNLKRTLSILLLSIFVFNLGGHYLFFWALKVQATQEFSARLDVDNYDESQTFEIKIPFALPYPIQSSGYERQYGQFNYQGEQYQVVKQKYENDVLTIVCLKDAKANHLEKVSEAFSETSGAQPVKEGSLNLPLKVFQDYISFASAIANTIQGWSQPIQHTLYFSSNYQVSRLAFVPPPWA
jgi:hypothetical protein